MATPGFQELFESHIKNYFYVQRDLYMTTRVQTIPSTLATETYISSTHLRSKALPEKNVDCYTAYTLS